MAIAPSTRGAKQKTPRAGFDCLRGMRWPLVALLLSSFPSLGATPAIAIARRPAVRKPAAQRQPWLLFPLDVRRFEHVSSKFGMRRMEGHKKLHRGVDLVAPRGSWVVAAREGKIADAGHAKACGWYVTLEHPNGWRSVYCHLRKDPRLIGITPGLEVPAMGVVGEVGSTGHSTGPHLHFTLLDEQ